MVGLEPTTCCLRNSCSTTELHRRVAWGSRKNFNQWIGGGATLVKGVSVAFCSGGVGHLAVERDRRLKDGPPRPHSGRWCPASRPIVEGWRRALAAWSVGGQDIANGKYALRVRTGCPPLPCTQRSGGTPDTSGWAAYGAGMMSSSPTRRMRPRSVKLLARMIASIVVPYC